MAMVKDRVNEGAMSDRSDDIRKPEGDSQLEQALSTVEAQLAVIFEAAERSESDGGPSSGLILEQLLDFIYKGFDGLLPYDRIALAIVDDDGDMTRSRWACADAESVTMGSGPAVPVHHAVVQELLASGQALIIGELQTYLDEHAESGPPRFIVEQGMRSSLTCPLATEDGPVGLIELSSRQARAYKEQHKQELEEVASHLAAILQRSRMYERLGELNWQLRVARDALEYQANHDGHTRLLNRNAIIALATQELARAARPGKPIAIVMCDIDGLEGINETHGRLVGDAVVRAVADRLKGALRSYETVGRYGGEEFLITLYDCEADYLPHVMERLRKAVGEREIDTDAGALMVTISSGAAAGSGAAGDIDTFVRIAEEAVKDAKQAGRDCHRVRPVEGNGS
jgi:diguanylate cyclase (GGDEF)-like protein